MYFSQYGRVLSIWRHMFCEEHIHVATYYWKNKQINKETNASCNVATLIHLEKKINFTYFLHFFFFFFFLSWSFTMPFYIVNSSSRTKQVDVTNNASKFMLVIRNRNRTWTNKIVCSNSFRRETSLLFFRCRCHSLGVYSCAKSPISTVEMHFLIHSFKLNVCVRKFYIWLL